MTPELKPELKPCPFCGNATATELIAWDDSDWVNHDFGGGGYVVICSATPGAGGCGSTTGWSESAQDAIDAWNHRPAADIDLPTQERNAAELAFGLSDEALRIADYFDTGYGHFGERKRAAALLRQQHAEIERLTQQFDPDTHAHRPDCCGPQIDTHCLGCTTAEGDAHAAEIARLTEQCDKLLSKPAYAAGYGAGYDAGFAFGLHRAAAQIEARANVVGEQPWYGAIASELFAMAERIRNHDCMRGKP